MMVAGCTDDVRLNRSAWQFSIGWLLLVWPLWVSADLDVASFLEQHWQRPIAHQEPVPEHFSEQEASLQPEDCGGCHQQQYKDWSTSLHSKAMGPGLMGQLVEMSAHARTEHQSCLRCHAPLSEQADQLVSELTGQALPSDQLLHRQGLVCAACHLRKQQRFGPPRKDGSVPAATDNLPHDGWQAADAFSDSQFCAACHQFEPNEFALNGKLLENTYEEWKQSPYAAEGISCQQCHMPERRHLWRGIHDPEMVRSGVTIQLSEVSLQGREVRGQMQMENTGTGHRFPTYVTPQVVMHGFQVNSAGDPIASTDSYFVVARRVSLDLSTEIFDTRLAPGESATLDYHMPRHTDAAALVFRVWVEPDTFYQQFFNSRLQSNPASQGAGMLRQAYENAASSRFTLYRQELPFPDR